MSNDARGFFLDRFGLDDRSVGAALDTRAWLRFHMGDVSGARADLDRALMLYRAPSATVHFHAAIVAHADGADEVALFHVKQGFLVLNPQHDPPDLVARARVLAEALYAERRWHPGGMVAWLAAVRFSVRADLMHTGEQPDMANRIEGSYIATEFMGSLETEVYEIEPGLIVQVEQHRSAAGRERRMGDRETICWPAEAAVLIE